MISVYKSQAWMLNIVYIRASIVIFHYYMLQNKQYNSRWPDILPNGHFDERTLRRKDNSPKIEKFSGFTWKGSLTRSTSFV